MKKRTKDTIEHLSSHFNTLLLPHEKIAIKLGFDDQSCNTLPISYNYKEFCDYVIQNGLASIIYSKHKSILDPESLKLLQQSYFTNLIKSAQIEKTVRWISQTLNNKNIQHLFLKGSLLAAMTYQDSAWRPMSDIDILIESGQAEDAYKALLGSGAKGNNQHLAITDNDHHLPGLWYNNILIEVHQSLFPINAKYTFDNKILFDSSIIWKKDQNQLPGPDVISLAFYIATHLYYTYQRGGLRLSWLYDLKTLSPLLSLESSNTLKQMAEQMNLQSPLTFAGFIYYCFSGKILPHWPMFEQYYPNKIEIKRIVNSFRSGKQQDTKESYGLIMEQFREAKGLKNKSSILLNRLTKNGQLKGFDLLKHAFTIGYRFSVYTTNSILKRLNIK